MKTSRLLSFALLMLVLMVSAFQSLNEPWVDKLSAALQAYEEKYPQEKIYVQTDKPFYKPGEDLWFNVFILNSQHLATTVSDVVYVEFYDPRGNLAARRELLIDQGSAQGEFPITDDMPGGLYTLKAYTQWLKNFGTASYFQKDIQIQQVITPRLLLTLDFQKEAYGASDTVTARLRARDLDNSPLRATVQASVRLEGNTIQTFSLETDHAGEANVTFTLPTPLSSSDGLLHLQVSAQGRTESIARAIPITLNNIALQFFPEGGDLVEGVSSRVAFQATNPWGKGADVRGEVMDDTQRVVATFTSFHMGMGAFDFTPEKGKTYTARITQPAGIAETFTLPSAQATGYALRANIEDDQHLQLDIHAPQRSEAFLVAHAQSKLVYQKKVVVKPGTQPVKVDTQNFPDGIVVFTLFDIEGHARCERLVYIDHHRELRIQVTPDKTQYAPRDKVTLQIRTTDEHDRPVAAVLSMATVDDQLLTLAHDKQDHLLSRMLLTSELKGTIQDPAFYFDAREPKAKAARDYLMLTHGWRRFTWQEVLHPTQDITYMPEQVSLISGYVSNGNEAMPHTEVTLLELDRQKRIVQIKTDERGRFAFYHTDPASKIMLTVAHPFVVVLDRTTNNPESLAQQLITTPGAPIQGVRKQKAAVAEANAEDGGLDMVLDEDVSQLNEVVVTAMGVANRAQVAGSIVMIRQEEIPMGRQVEQVLQGRVPGVQVSPAPGMAGAGQQIRIRGVASLSNQQDPLYIIDGVALAPAANGNFLNGEMISPNDINRIEVIKGAEATALYGSQGANGVIVITTHHQTFAPYQNLKKNRYNSMLIKPRQFSAVRTFYRAPPHRREDLRQEGETTVYWNGLVKTDVNGQATISYYAQDDISAFRITAEGFGGKGLIGRQETTYATQVPISVDVKIPSTIGFEDTLLLPVMIRNTTPTARQAHLTLQLPPALHQLKPTPENITLAAGEPKTTWIAVTPDHTAGNFPIQIQVQSGQYEDDIRRSVVVQPVGFPRQLNFSGTTLQRDFTLDIPEVERGTLQGEVVIYTDLLSELFSGADGMLREPHGCFEQVSSSTFPNILALQYMRSTGQIEPDVEQKALQYIRIGYNKLAGYEIKGGGFDWFGSPPAHEGLSAYGLLEFHEMKKVYTGVSDAMVQRTQQWLLERRKGDGTYQLQSRGLDDFSKPGGDVTNAYITYALSETGITDLKREFNYSLAEAWKKRDMYLLALNANTAYNLGLTKEYQQLMDYYNQHVAQQQIDNFKADHSVVWSQGKSLQVEIVALWAQAMMKSPQFDVARVKQCMDFLSRSREHGTFGSTQATVLALRALCQYAQFSANARGNGTVLLSFDQQQTDRAVFTADTRNAIVMNNFSDMLQTGTHQLSLQYPDTQQPLPYGVHLQWNSKTPASTPGCKLQLTVGMQAERVRVQDVVRMTVNLKNITATGVPMSMAVVGIPAGLSVQPWQLKALQEKKVFDFYEIEGNRLMIYYRQLEAHAQRAIHLDLKAEVPGTYTAPASSAYLYYTDELKYWTKGSTVRIVP